jgi:hypothetical protein
MIFLAFREKYQLGGTKYKNNIVDTNLFYF